jgi:hypothetical protein
MRKQLKNIIRGLAQKPLALIGYCLIGLLLAGSLVTVLIMPSGTVRHGSNEMFSAIFTCLVVIALYFSLKQGIERGSSYFRFSDVNLVFTAPLKPSKVLLYGFIKHMGTSLLFVLFTIFQIPNVKNNFMLQSYGVWMILLAVLFYSLLYPIVGMVLYTISSVSSKRRAMVKNILNLLIMLFIVGFFFMLLEKKSFTDTLTTYMNGYIFTWIPLVGQIKTIASAAVFGIDSAFWISVFILTAFIITFIVVLYKTDLDYYEDVLAATEQTEKRIKAKRQGRDSAAAQMKVRKIKGGFSSVGARSIFEKSLLEYRKVSYFLFFDRNSLIIALAGIGIYFVMPEGQTSIFFCLFFSAYMLFFLIVQGKWPTELDKPYVFLIPEGNGKKLLYTTLPENIKNMCDGVLLFSAYSFMFKVQNSAGYQISLPLIIICAVCYTLYGAVYIYGDLVSRRLFGGVHSKVMKVFIKLFISGFVVLPGIIIMGIVWAVLRNEIVSLMIIALWNFLVALGLFFASKGIFNNIEVA